MKDVGLSLADVVAKTKAARTDIGDLVSLKAIAAPKDGESFMVAKTLYIWSANDTTPDDGRTSLARQNVSTPGRFRIPKILLPQHSR